MLYLGALISWGLFYLAWKQRKNFWGCFWIAYVGLLPLVTMFIFLHWAAVRASSVGEVAWIMMLISGAAALALAAPAAALFVAIARNPLGWAIGIGATLGFSLTPFLYLALSAPFGYNQPEFIHLMLLFCMNGLFGGLIVGGCLACQQEVAKSLRWALAIFAFCSMGAALFWMPDVLFRVKHSPTLLDDWVELGARRALKGDEPGTTYATQLLAERGDMAMVEKLRQDFAAGRSLPSAPNPAEIISKARPNDPEAAATLRAALKLELDRYHPDTSFGEEERRIEDLCRILGDRRDADAVPLFIRTYHAHPTYANFRNVAAKALIRIPSEEADRACAKAIAKLHPNLNRDLIAILRQQPGEATRRAADAKDADYEKWKRAVALGKTPVSALTVVKNVEGLRIKSRSGSVTEKSDAAIALIRLKDAYRSQAVLNALPYIAFRGSELRGLKDPELVSLLSARAPKDRHLYRLLGSWAPVGSEETLKIALVQYNMEEGAIGLGRLGSQKAVGILMNHWTSNQETSVEVTLLVALSIARDAQVAALLQKVAGRRDSRPALQSETEMIYASDVAALCLERMGKPCSHTYRGDRLTAERWMGFLLR